MFEIHTWNLFQTADLCLLQYNINPLTPNDIQRRRAVSPLKIKIPIMRENQQMHQLFIHFINYVW
jgi:hypothetical protein